MKRYVTILLVTSFCIAIFSPLALAQNTPYHRGYEDGKRAANQDVDATNMVVEALWGALLGPLPVLDTLVNEPKVPSSRLETIQNRSTDYRKGFKEGYKDTVEQSTLLSRIGGWGGWIVVWAVAFNGI